MQAPRTGPIRQPRPAAARVAQLRDARVPVELRRGCAPAGRGPDVAQGLHRRLRVTRADEGADTARRRREAPSDGHLLCLAVSQCAARPARTLVLNDDILAGDLFS